MRRTFDNISALLASEGATWHDIVRTTCYLRDIERDYKIFNEERTAFYQEQDLDPLPASTGIQAILCRPDLLVEIEAIAMFRRESPEGESNERGIRLMRRVVVCFVVAAVLGSTAWAQPSSPCACGSNPPGRPAPRSLNPYTGAPEDLRPFSKFTTPYYEFYQDLVEYNGAARDIPDPDLKDLDEIRIGFLAPLYDHPDQVLGNRMLNGARMAIDEANAAGGYGGKPFRLVTHNDYDNWQNRSVCRRRRFQRFRHLGRCLERCCQDDLRRQSLGRYSAPSVRNLRTSLFV